MTKSTHKHDLGVTLLRLLAKLPLPVIHGLGCLAGWLVYLLPNKRKRITQINLSLAFPDSPRARRRRLCRQSLAETGKGIFEKGALYSWPQARILNLIRDVDGAHHLEQALQQGRGVILAIPHLGDWEMIGLFCSSHYPMTSLYREQKGAMENYIRRGRERFGAKLVPANASGVKQLYRALGQGHIIAILPDQNPGAGTGVFVPFFGTPTNTMVLLPRLAQRSKACVLYSFAERLPLGRGYRLHFRPAEQTIMQADLPEAAHAMNAGLEALICALPQQYWWSYPRFRQRPAGEAPIYPFRV